MPGEGACRMRDRHPIRGVAGMVLLTAAMAAAQPGRPDLSKVIALRDIEYVPGGHERQKLDLYVPKEAPAGGGFKDPRVDVLVTEFFNKHLRK